MNLLRVLVDGLVLGSGYMLASVGLTLVFGILGIYNFAHGEFVMLGAYIVFVFFAQNHFPFIVTALLAMLVIGSLAAAVERGLFKPARKKPFNAYLISIGLVYILQVLALLIWGGIGKANPLVTTGLVKIGGITFTLERLLLIPIVLSVMFVIWILLERTKYGRAVRATSQDPRSATLMGISVDGMSTLVMFIAGSLAGLAGAVMSQFTYVSPTFGSNVIMKAFVCVIVGGSGSIGGTIVAALIFGLLDSSVSAFISPSIAVLADAILLAIILVIRPQGIFGNE